jgi:hypothetical protein
MKHLPLSLAEPQSDSEWVASAAIFREYGDSLGIDLSFQNFEEELASLPGLYAAPRGTVLLAWVDGELAGCCALRPIDDIDVPNAAEMKRLYVRPAFAVLVWAVCWPRRCSMRHVAWATAACCSTPWMTWKPPALFTKSWASSKYRLTITTPCPARITCVLTSTEF